MRPPILRVRDLTVKRESTILHDVDWTVGEGENWVLLGPNGSGKTSLLSVLTGYLMPTSGVISIGDSEYGRTDWRDVRRRIGIVSGSVRRQIDGAELAIEVVISGKDAIINYWGEAQANERKQAQEILEQLACGHLQKRRWAVLSEGERQRVLIGRAMMAGYSLLFLDEPCAGLDPVARESFLQFIDSLARRPNAPALVFVTHHVEEIIPAFTHALIMRKGTILKAGAISETLTTEALSEAFDTQVELTHNSGRYQLRLTSPSSFQL